MFLIYKHVLHGLRKVFREEGFKKLFTGGTSATTRGVLVTISQTAFEDQINEVKSILEIFVSKAVNR
uniref:Uncharacterized protein n=1 Tax=Glossina pallidipes TaxID=7398 RepID=A0A1B0AGN6_GLOPL